MTEKLTKVTALGYPSKPSSLNKDLTAQMNRIATIKAVIKNPPPGRKAK